MKFFFDKCVIVYEISISYNFIFVSDSVWNILDLCSVVLLLAWLLQRFFSFPIIGSADVYLALSAIFVCWGLLKLLSLFDGPGQLVVTIIDMFGDLVSFLSVFIVGIFGYLIFFEALKGRSKQNIFIVLFDAAVGQHSFGDFDEYEPDHPGCPARAPTQQNTKINSLMLKIVLVTYIIFAMIILLNLLVARMSSTHESVYEKAFEKWSAVKATNVKKSLLLTERNAYCMLPAPLNGISILCYFFLKMVRNSSSNVTLHTYFYTYPNSNTLTNA